MPRCIDFGRSDALGQCNVLIRRSWRGQEIRYYACTYLRRKLFARGGKRINVAAQLLRPAFCSERASAVSAIMASRRHVADALCRLRKLCAVTNIRRDFNLFKLAFAAAAGLVKSDIFEWSRTVFIAFTLPRY